MKNGITEDRPGTYWYRRRLTDEETYRFAWVSKRQWNDNIPIDPEDETRFFLRRHNKGVNYLDSKTLQESIKLLKEEDIKHLDIPNTPFDTDRYTVGNTGVIIGYTSRNDGFFALELEAATYEELENLAIKVQLPIDRLKE